MSQEQIEALTSRILGVGQFRRCHVDEGGPMGSGIWRFTDGAIDVEVSSDRGNVGVALGRSGRTMFAPETWADAIGLDVGELSSGERQLSFFLNNLASIRTRLELDQTLDEVLERVNWRRVRKSLGLPDSADPRDPRTWRRPG